MRARAALSMRLALIGCLASTLMAASAQEAASQTNLERDAPIRKFSGVEEIAQECTTSDSTAGFVDMPGATRDFELRGNATEEVVVMFHGASSLSGQPLDTGFVRLLIDGAIQSPGDQVPFIGTDDGGLTSGAYSFTWQTAPLTPGHHTALIQWRTDLGSDFCVDARSLIILHR